MIGPQMITFSRRYLWWRRGKQPGAYWLSLVGRCLKCRWFWWPRRVKNFFRNEDWSDLELIIREIFLLCVQSFFFVETVASQFSFRREVPQSSSLSDSEVHIPSPPSSHNSEHFFLMSFYTVKLISRSAADIKVCMIVSLQYRISLPCKLVMGLVKLLLYLELINVSCKE